MTSTGLLFDLRVALRSLPRQPGFTALVVLTLGLGIAATTTIYSVVDAVVVRQLPYPDADRLVAVGNTFPGREWDDQRLGLQHLAGVSHANFVELQQRARSFDILAAAERRSVLMPDRGDGPELVPMMSVTSGFLELLSVRPALGRSFLTEDFAPQAAPVVLLSHGAWLERYGGDRTVVGRELPGAAGSGFTVVGVLPAGFRPPEAMVPETVELWTPLDPSHPRYLERGRRSLNLLGRLREGVAPETARAEVDAIGAALASEFPEGNVYPNGDRLGYGVNTLRSETVGTSGTALFIFLGAAALLLLIACLNAANLLALRSLDRLAELDIRLALGARRWQVVRQLMVESLVLALAGGVLGVALTFAGVKGFLSLGPTWLPRMGEIAVNPRILGLTALITLAAGLVTGLTPMLRLGRDRPGGRSRTLTARGVSSPGLRLRMALVAVQLGLAPGARRRRQPDVPLLPRAADR